MEFYLANNVLTTISLNDLYIWLLNQSKGTVDIQVGLLYLSNYKEFSLANNLNVLTTRLLV